MTRDKVVWLDVQKILAQYNPFEGTAEPWYQTAEEMKDLAHLVLEAIHDEELVDEEWSGADSTSTWTLRRHAQRIAYLMANGWDVPICFTAQSEFVSGCNVDDGNHRFCAAVMLGLPCIEAWVSVDEDPEYVDFLYTGAKRKTQACA